MKNMNSRFKALAILVSFLAQASPAFAQGGGNGSSGIGNMIVDDAFHLHAKIPAGDRVTKVGSTIVDEGSGEKILEVDRVKSSELKGLYGDQLVNATLGATQGFEVEPTRAQGAMGAQNLWIVCRPGEAECVRLTPLSKTNPKVPALVGALFHPDSNKKSK